MDGGLTAARVRLPSEENCSIRRSIGRERENAASECHRQREQQHPTPARSAPKLAVAKAAKFPQRGCLVRRVLAHARLRQALKEEAAAVYGT